MCLKRGVYGCLAHKCGARLERGRNDGFHSVRPIPSVKDYGSMYVNDVLLQLIKTNTISLTLFTTKYMLSVRNGLYMGLSFRRKRG